MQLRICGHHLLIEVDGGTRERAVLRDLRTEHIPHTRIDVFLQKRQQILFRIFLPAVDADLPVTYVGTEDHALRTVFFQPADKQLGIRDGYRTHRHHRGAGCKGLLDVFVGLDATAEVHREVGLCGDGLQHLIVHDMFRFRPVEVHHMQSLEADLLKLLGHLSR